MKILVKVAAGKILVFDPHEVFYIEGERNDSLVRTARKRLYRSTQPLASWEKRLRGTPLVRIHRSYLVNLDRVREIRRRGGDPNDWELKLDPPVNAVLPVSRKYYATVLKALEG